ncbi:MAG TPA: hypothetical protein VJL60_04535 [Gammaproteobacteria bacterium]|nr:hypothetical protein [Gammaproteobacteria bacterium]
MTNAQGVAIVIGAGLGLAAAAGVIECVKPHYGLRSSDKKTVFVRAITILVVGAGIGGIIGMMFGKSHIFAI